MRSRSSPTTTEKITLLNVNASQLSRVSSTIALTNAESRNSGPRTIITVDTVRGPRAAAARRTSATTTEMVDKRPLEDIPRTGWPWIEKNCWPLAKPRRAKTSRNSATSTAPMRWTAYTRAPAVRASSESAVARGKRCSRSAMGCSRVGGTAPILRPFAVGGCGHVHPLRHCAPQRVTVAGRRRRAMSSGGAFGLLHHDELHDHDQHARTRDSRGGACLRPPRSAADGGRPPAAVPRRRPHGAPRLRHTRLALRGPDRRHLRPPGPRPQHPARRPDGAHAGAERR